MHLSGIATYREGPALPPDAVLEVTLEALPPGEDATVVARTIVDPAGPVPIAFRLAWPEGLAGVPCRVVGQVRHHDALLFITHWPVPVTGPGAPVTLELKRFSALAGPAG